MYTLKPRNHLHYNDFTLHMDGEASKRHPIPIDMLSDIGKSLQDLLQKLATYDLPL